MDKRLVAQDGYYQSTFHLAMYFFDRREIDSLVVLWKDYIAQFPRDGSGYRKLIQSYSSFGENGFAEIEETFARWASVDSTDRNPKKEYADFCLHAGNTYYGGGKLSEAGELYGRAIRLDSTDVGAYEQIAQACASPCHACHQARKNLY